MSQFSIIFVCTEQLTLSHKRHMRIFNCCFMHCQTLGKPQGCCIPLPFTLIAMMNQSNTQKVSSERFLVGDKVHGLMLGC